jgi:hypothetical protein
MKMLQFFGSLCIITMLASSLPTVSQASEQDAQPYMDATAQAKAADRAAGGDGTENSPGHSASSRHKKRKKKRIRSTKNQASDPNLEQKAIGELLVRPEEQSTEVVASPATIRTTLHEVQDPTQQATFKLALTVQPFHPAGHVKLPGLNAYELSDLRTQELFGLDLLWLPLRLSETSPARVGFYGFAGYGQNSVNLKGPTGVQLADTTLHSIITELGGAASWQPKPESLLGAHVQLGIGRFSSVQSSSSSYGNSSQSEFYATSGIFGDVFVSRNVGLFAGYVYRLPLGAEPAEIVLQRSNLVAGLSGSFH